MEDKEKSDKLKKKYWEEGYKQLLTQTQKREMNKIRDKEVDRGYDLDKL